jgi:hypothetical protein
MMNVVYCGRAFSLLSGLGMRRREMNAMWLRRWKVKLKERSICYPLYNNSTLYLISPAALGLEIYSASNRNEYLLQAKKNFLGSRARLARNADNLTAICEPIV